MSYEKIQEFVKSNEGKEVSTEDYTSFVTGLATEDTGLFDALTGTKAFMSKKDAAITKALQTHKDQTIPKLQADLESKLKAEFEAKYNPPQTEAEKQLAELTNKFAAMEREKQLLEIRGEVQGSLPDPGLLNYLNLPLDKEEAGNVVSNFSEIFNNLLDKKLSEKLKEGVRNPATGNKKASGDPTNIAEMQSLGRDWIAKNKDKADAIIARGV